MISIDRRLKIPSKPPTIDIFWRGRDDLKAKRNKYAPATQKLPKFCIFVVRCLKVQLRGVGVSRIRYTFTNIESLLGRGLNFLKLRESTYFDNFS